MVKEFLQYFLQIMLKHIKQILFLLCILPGMGSIYAQQQKVRAKNGEGVTLLLQRYNLPPQLYESKFRKLNKGKFTSDGGLILGVNYLLPTKKQEKTSKKSSAKGKPSSKKEHIQTTKRKVPDVQGKLSSDKGKQQARKEKQTTKKKQAGKEEQVSESNNRRQKSASKGYEPLFGKKYARYETSSNELKNAVFYLVSGHGGPDPGAIGLYNGHRLHEDEYAYDIILRLGRELLSRGAKVYFIIQDPKDGIRDDQVLKNSKEETCMGKAIPLDQVKRLNQRCTAINQLYNKDKATYKRAVFIHVDSRSKGKQTDVFFYHSPGSSMGKRLAKNIRQTFDRKYDKHQPNRGFNGTVSARNLHVLRNTTPAAVFLELGNIQNQQDQKRLVLNSNRQALARWIAEGIAADYKKKR